MSDKTTSKPLVAVYMRVGIDSQAKKGLTALYCRLAYADNERIAEQENRLREYAKEKQYGFCAVYRDNGESGVKLDRPGLGELLDNTRSGNVKRVIVTDIARLARDFILIQKLIDLFTEHEVEFISVNDGGMMNHLDFIPSADELLKCMKNYRHKKRTAPAHNMT